MLGPAPVAAMSLSASSILPGMEPFVTSETAFATSRAMAGDQS